MAEQDKMAQATAPEPPKPSDEPTQPVRSIQVDSNRRDIYGYSRTLNRLIKTHLQGLGATIWDKDHSRAEFNAQQRAIWKRIREEAATDDSIPFAMFSPPQMSVEVKVEYPEFRPFNCPCELDDYYGYVEIQAPENSEHGITTDMFIQQLCEALYGRDPEAGQDEQAQLGSSVQGERHDGYTVGDEWGRPILDYFYSKSQLTEAKLGNHLVGWIPVYTQEIKIPE